MTHTTLVAAAIDLETQGRAAKEAADQQIAEVASAAEQIQSDLAAAERAARTAHAGASGQYLTIMRQLTEEVREARRAAEEAVRSGSDGLAAWVAYRRARATNRGRWDVLGYRYMALTGRPAPPGEWGPEQFHPGSPGAEESFARFVQIIVTDLERDTFEEARQDTGAELREHQTRQANA